jgi:hypothetical protein
VLRRIRGRTKPEVSGDLKQAHEGFVVTRQRVEEAKAALVSTVRSGRVEGVPLAEGLLGFETKVAAARDAMPSWRVDRVEDVWRACDEGIAEAARRAEHLRLEGTPAIYEELIAAVEQLLDPLEPFDAAARRFRDLGL